MPVFSYALKGENHIKKLLLSLLADKKSRRGVAKVLGGILIILIVLAGAVFSMMSIGTRENAAIIAYSFSLSDELPSWDGSVASSNAMREIFRDIDGCIKEIRAELQAEADRQREESEDEDAPVVTVSISIDTLWVKSVFIARYYGEPQPSHDEVKAFVKTFIDGATPSGMSEETLALAKEIYEEVNRQLYESGNNTAIPNVHAWLWEMIKDDTGVGFILQDTNNGSGRPLTVLSIRIAAFGMRQSIVPLIRQRGENAQAV